LPNHTRWGHPSAIGLAAASSEVFALLNGRRRRGQGLFFHLYDRGVPKTFCLPDIKFRLANNKQTSQMEAFDLPDKLIHRVLITFTHQKNGNNGEQRVFVRNKNNATLCFVTLMLRIFKRFIFFTWLGGHSHTSGYLPNAHR
jgi:hypothetical protein